MPQDYKILSSGPNVLHPEIPSAVGSRNSLARDGRDEYAEARMFIDEEVDKILNHIHAKLPAEVVGRMNVMGTVKSKLHTYYNQSLQNMLNRYLTTVEDELSKKVRDLISREEHRNLNYYSPRPISFLIDRVAGADKFNSGEVEKSIVNMYGHLQGHVQREMNDLETHTNSLLRRKTDVGAFVRGENAYAIAKCSFRDDETKPTTVYQLKLALNILDAELISRIYPYHVTAGYLLKELTSKRVTEVISKEVERANYELVDEGKAEMNPEEMIFERINMLERYVSDETEEAAPRYAMLPKNFYDLVENVGADQSLDPLDLRSNIEKILNSEDLRNRGWNTAVNSITHVLDWSRMGYQHIENYKSSRHLAIREYESTQEELLPDERYELRLTYYTTAQLRAMQEAYKQQMEEFERTIFELWKVVEEVHQEYLREANLENWDDFSSRLLGGRLQDKRPGWLRYLFGGDEEEDLLQEEETLENVEAETAQEPDEKSKQEWNELVFIQADESEFSHVNPTMENRLKELENRFHPMENILAKVFEGREDNTLGLLLTGRMEFLYKEFRRFTAQVNPYHVNAGLLLDVNIVSIKRKGATMMNMANVLNEFLYSISSGFQDQAFATFARRRSTMREDISGEFDSAVMAATADED